MFCGKCGHELVNDSVAYCSNCGAPVKDRVVSSEEKKRAVVNFDFRKKMFIALTVVLVIIIFTVIKSSVKSDKERIAGTWEERSYNTSYNTYTYEAGEGDKVTLGKDGTIIDSDSFLGYEFGDTVPVDVLSWSVEGDTLIFYTKYGNVEYVPYMLSGRKLTLYFSDKINAELYKIK